jgi:ATP-dependent DNA helicase RecQ
MASAQKVLKRHYGYDSFREGQAEVISAILNGRDVLGVMPTGAGKSLCFQIPAIILPGITLIISPLISLMRDQVQALAANGIPAAYINSSLSYSQFSRAMANARAGTYKIIYAAPERLLNGDFAEFARGADISQIAVDEAHCISQWGHDFRPSYLDIPEFVEQLRARPAVTAFTATATPKVRQDILDKLGLNSPFTITTGFNRHNLYFEVKNVKRKYETLIEYLSKNDRSGIIYCASRKNVEQVADKLCADGFKAARYHAGMADAERGKAQDDFLYDRVRLIVATNAFGMGIDKSDARFVIHYNMPKNMESYYQEAGRAGRDGAPADCLLLYSRGDIVTARYLIDQGSPETRSRDYALLREMVSYCETGDCLREFILRYFGETKPIMCDNCSNCRSEGINVDVTIPAQKILSCISRLNRTGRAYGFGVISKVLQGRPDEYLNARGLDKLPTFGAMQEDSPEFIRSVFDLLRKQGYISVSDNQYHTVSAEEKANEVLRNGVKVFMKVKRAEPESAAWIGDRRRVRGNGNSFDMNPELWETLRETRRGIAEENGVPAFVVFSDASLLDMCRKHPLTEREFLDVSGVGEVKLERYGGRFLKVLKSFTRAGNTVSEPAAFNPALLKEHFVSDEGTVPISYVADRINVGLITLNQKKTSAKALNDLLESKGYLLTEQTDGGSRRRPTLKGEAAGIVWTLKTSANGLEYFQTLFDERSQKMVLELFIGEYGQAAM